MVTETGKIEYTGRAFVDDAGLAMSGDPVKALIELITNADDAYERRDSSPSSSSTKHSSIIVSYSKGKKEETFLSVTDQALGLDLENMKKCFGFLGAEQSGFTEGQKVRGLFGRGAKDTSVFGKTVFESIHNDLYHRFVVHPDLSYSLDGNLPATKSIRHKLGIENEANGMRATIIFDDPSDLGEFKRLRDRISRTVQLREITANRELLLKRVDDMKPALTERIIWTTPKMEKIVDTNFRLDDYPEAEVQLTLYKLSQLQPGQVNQESLHGIEIRSGKTIFSNDNFGDTSIEIGWIHGVLKCNHIEALIRAADKAKQSSKSRLVRRDRDGLNKDHVFYKALQQKVAQILAPIIENLRPKSDKIGGSEDLRKDLDRAGRQLAALLQADLARLDEDDIGRGPRPSVSSPIIVIPPIALVVVTKRQTLTVLLASSVFSPEVQLLAVSSNPTSVSINEINKEFRNHTLMPDTKVSTIVIEGLELGSSEIIVQYGEHSCNCAITVINESIKIDEPPTFLEWDSDQSTCTINKRRSLRLRAPLDMIVNEPFNVSVTCDNSTIEILTPKLKLDVVGDAWLEARAVIVGRQLDIKAELVALSNQGKAITTIRVTEPKAKLGTNLQIDIHDSSAGNLRGRLSQTGDGLNILIFGQHSAIRPILGKKLPDGSFESEKNPAARVMIAEAVTTVIVEWLITKDSNKNPQAYSDASAVLAERNKLVTRYLPVARDVLQSKDSDWV